MTQIKRTHFPPRYPIPGTTRRLSSVHYPSALIYRHADWKTLSIPARCDVPSSVASFKTIFIRRGVWNFLGGPNKLTTSAPKASLKQSNLPKSEGVRSRSALRSESKLR